jgi:hypothetical protein
VDEVLPREEWRVSGRLLSELDPATQAVITWRMTDQAIDAADAKIDKRFPRVEFVRDAWDQSVARMEDDQYLLTDPFSDVVNPLKAANPDQDFRLLSDTVVKRRGMRGWQPVRDDKTGDPVRVGGMVVGSMPKPVTERRRARNRALAEEAVEEQTQAYQVNQERFIRDGQRGGIEVLRPDEMLQDARNPNRAAVSGFQHQRGL